MRDIERELGDLGQRADATTPRDAHLPKGLLSRIRLARFLTAGAAVVVALAVIGGGTFAAHSLSGEPELAPAEESFPDQGTDAETVVGQGEVSGQAWSLVAYESESGLCVDLRFEGSSNGGCGFDVPGKADLGLNVGTRTGLEKTSVHGAVSKRVSTLTVQLDGGRQVEIPVIRGSGFEVDFFAGFLPPGAEGIVEARDSQGTLLGRKQLAPQSTSTDSGSQTVFVGKTEDGFDVSATIRTEAGQVCFVIPDALDYQAAHLHLRSDPEFGDPVLAAFFEPPDGPTTRGCVPAEEFDEEALSSGNTSQYVDLHISENRYVILEPASSGSTTDDDRNTSNFNAVWPEDTYERAEDACTTEAGRLDVAPERFRLNPGTTAATFGLEVLGWDGDVRVFERSDRSSDVVFEVRRDAEDDGRTAKGPAVLVYVAEAFSDCWSVAQVSPVMEGDPQESGSMSVRGRAVFMRFDKRGANSVTHEVGYGGEVTRYEWTEGDSENVEFQLDFEPQGTGHFLLLYRDVYGGVIGAQGSGLPEGDFAAG